MNTGKREIRIGPKDLFDTGEILAGLYRVEAPPIQGGMGLVYRVHHNDWDVDLAMKRPYAALFVANAKKAREMFVGECSSWIDLGVHPNIVVCYYFREINDMISIFSEWMDGGSLKQWIGRSAVDPKTGQAVFSRGRLYDGDDAVVLERILDIAIQVARGLHYAHEHGLVHQDVKPDNILLDSMGNAKVTDFGVSRVRSSASAGVPRSGKKTMSVHSGGFSKPYCSPEQAEGRDVTRRSDIWSWAVTLLEMLVVDRQWGDGTVAGYGFRRYLKNSPFEIPIGLDDLLARCFENDEANRPHDFSDIEMELLVLYEMTFGREYPRSYLEAVGDTADALNNRALSYIDIGSFADAEECWMRALRADHNHLESRFNQSLHNWRNGLIDDVELLRIMNDIAQNHAGDSRIDRLTAQIHLERCDRAAAIACLQNAIDADASDPAAAQLLTYAESIGETRVVRQYEGHTSALYSLCYLDGGKKLLAGGDDHRIILWDTRTGEKLRTLLDHEGCILCMSVSLDGRRMISGGDDEDHAARVWDLDTGECLHRLAGHEGDIRAVSMSPDGKYAVTGGVDRRIILWDVDTGERLRTYEEHTQYVCGLSFLSDGERFVSASMDSSLRLWSVLSDTSQRAYSVHEAWALSVVASRDMRTLVSGYNDGSIRIWDMETGACRNTIRIRTREKDIGSVRLSEDGATITCSMEDCRLRFFDTTSGCCLQTFPRQEKRLRRVDANADLTHVVCINGKTAVEYERPRCGYRAGWIMCRVVSAAERFALEERFLAIYDDAERALQQRDIQRSLTLLEQARAIPGHEDDASCIALNNRAGRFCAPVSIRTVRERAESEISKRAVRSVWLNADGTRVLTAGDDAHIRLYDVGGTTSFCQYDGHSDKVLLARFSGDEHRIVSYAKDRTLKIWDASNAQELNSFAPVAEGYSVLDVALDADGAVAFAAGDDKAIRLFNVESGACVTELLGHEDAVSAICVSFDGKRVLSGSWDQKVRLWDVESGKTIKTFSGHEQDVVSVCMSMDGRYALSGGYDRTMILWDVESECILHAFSNLSAPVTNVSMSVNGRYLFSGCKGGSMELWDRETKRRLRTFTGHSDGICAAISANGRSVVSGGASGTLKIWDIDWVYRFSGWTEWDDAARPYLERFLLTHPRYTDHELDELAETLRSNGLGHVRRDTLNVCLDRLQK